MPSNEVPSFRTRAWIEFARIYARVVPAEARAEARRQLRAIHNLLVKEGHGSKKNLRSEKNEASVQLHGFLDLVHALEAIEALDPDGIEAFFLTSAPKAEVEATQNTSESKPKTSGLTLVQEMIAHRNRSTRLEEPKTSASEVQSSLATHGLKEGPPIQMKPDLEARLAAHLESLVNNQMSEYVALTSNPNSDVLRGIDIEPYLLDPHLLEPKGEGAEFDRGSYLILPTFQITLGGVAFERGFDINGEVAGLNHDYIVELAGPNLRSYKSVANGANFYAKAFYTDVGFTLTSKLTCDKEPFPDRFRRYLVTKSSCQSI